MRPSRDSSVNALVASRTLVKYSGPLTTYFDGLRKSTSVLAAHPRMSSVSDSQGAALLLRCVLSRNGAADNDGLWYHHPLGLVEELASVGEAFCIV